MIFPPKSETWVGTDLCSIGGEHTKADHWESYSTTVCLGMIFWEARRLIMIRHPGVDACNTVLEVLLFAAAMNLGQSWPTVLTLFGGMVFSFYAMHSYKKCC